VKQKPELVRNRENDMEVRAFQKPRFLFFKPCLNLKVGTLRAAPMFARVVPYPMKVAIGAPLNMPAKGCGTAYHHAVGGVAFVRRKRMRVVVRSVCLFKYLIDRVFRHLTV